MMDGHMGFAPLFSNSAYNIFRLVVLPLLGPPLNATTFILEVIYGAKMFLFFFAITVFDYGWWRMCPPPTIILKF